MAENEQYIGEYRVLEKKGAGGMGRVYLAVHKDVPNLKVILKTLTDARLADRFRQEANKLAELDGHPNICRIKHFFQYGEDLVIAMEYIDGLTLDKKFELEGQPSMASSVKTICDVLDILEFAHGKGIAHRDIKPSNIMIDRNERIKIIDFGIAKGETDPNLTQAGAGLGTPAYMAPEQFNPERDTNFALADIYASGTCLYFLLTGTLPFEAANEFAMRDAKLFNPPRKPRDINPNIPKKLERLVLRALDPEPTKRFPSAMDMRKCLEEVLAELPDETEPMDQERTVALDTKKRTPTPPPTTRRRSKLPFIITGAAVVVAVALITWLLSGGEDISPPPELRSPASGTTVTNAEQFVLQWAEVPGESVRYDAQLASDRSFSQPMVFAGLSETSLQPDSLPDNGTYYWRVRAFDNTGDTSMFSDAHSVELALPPPKIPQELVSVTVNEASNLYIDGSLWQRNTTRARAPFDTGRHVIRVENSDAQPSEIVDTVTVTANETLELRYTMTIPQEEPEPEPEQQPIVGRLRIHSIPQFADISLNGKPTGFQTMFTFNDLKPGKYRVRLESQSGATFDTTVTVVADSLVAIVHEF